MWDIVDDYLLNNGLRSLIVGSTLSLAFNDTKSANGTTHKQIVKYPSTWERKQNIRKKKIQLHLNRSSTDFLPQWNWSSFV